MAAPKGEERIGKLERHLAMQEHELQTLAALVSIAINNSNSESDDADDDSRRGNVNPDHIWSCKKCGSRLGFYDPNEDTLRVRYKDFVAYIRLGEGGMFKVLCRSCSEMNEVNWVNEIPKEPPTNGAAGTKRERG